MKKLMIVLLLTVLIVIAGCNKPKPTDTTGETGDTGTNGLEEDISSIDDIDKELETDEISDDDLVIGEGDL